MTYDHSAWERVAEAVRKRREDDLGLSQMEVATAGDLSLDRVSSIERARGTSYRAGTLRSLERALKWAPRSIDAILDGGDPTPTVSVSATVYAASATARALPAEVQIIQSRLEQLGESTAWAAARAGVTERRWNEITNGMAIAEVQEIVLMARAVGVRSGDLRRAGRPDAANALQDRELAEEYGHQTKAELDAESMDILTRIHAAIAQDREGLDPTDKEITDQQAAGLARAIATLRRRRRDAS